MHTNVVNPISDTHKFALQLMDLPQQVPHVVLRQHTSSHLYDRIQDSDGFNLITGVI